MDGGIHMQKYCILFSIFQTEKITGWKRRKKV